MSAETSGDVCNVNDEEVLRKMWQDTEDFGKKKEIRSHMYKLREERLRNFYNSTDSGTEIRTTQQSSSLKEGNGPTHADSLIDQGFMSLKSKEIRDSESPTKDMHHFRVNEINRGGNQGWDVVSKNEVSQDGKTHTSMRTATTSGSEKIDRGVANYSAQCEQKASVYQDGDDKNFAKSAATSSKSVLRQEAKGGDDNNSFHSTSTSTNSSSKTVSQYRSTSDLKPMPLADNKELVVRKTYTTDVPADLKRNPNYIDGNTTVTTETRTLPDGTKVTTTRYETKGVSSKVNQHFHSSSTKTVNDSEFQKTLRQEATDLDRRYVVKDVPDSYIQKPIEIVISTQPKDMCARSDTRRVDEEVNSTHIVKKQLHKDSTRNSTDDTYMTKIINEKEYNPRQHPDTRVDSSENEVIRKTQNVEGKAVTSVKTTKVNQDEHYVSQKNQDVRYKTDTKPEPFNEDCLYTREPTRHEDFPVDKKTIDRPTSLTTSMDTTTSTTTSTKKILNSQSDNLKVDTVQSSVCKPELPEQQEVLTPVGDSPGDRAPKEYLIDNRQPGVHTPTGGRPRNQTPTGYRPQENTTLVEKITCERSPDRYFTPTQESKVSKDNTVVERTITTTTTKATVPDKIEMTITVKPQTEKVSTVTSQTTYQSDYTTKRISVDISPTHDAFARSLRASPDRDKKRGSLRSLKSSTSSLRSSTSPEKTHPNNRHPEISSLDRKQPSRFSPTKNKPDSRESSPTKKIVAHPYDKSPRRASTDSRTSTTTRKHNVDIHTNESRTTYDSSTITRRNKTRPRSRSVSPTTSASDIEFIKKDMVTDLDDDETLRKERRPTQTSPKQKNVHDVLIPKSPTKKYPEKDLHSEKPLKRRDTYEDRCRQILGINQETITNRTTKKPQPEEDSKTPEKKPVHKIQEYPSQIRRSPEKKEFTNVTEIQHKTVKKDTPGENKSKEDTQTSKPVRKTPEKGRTSQEVERRTTHQTDHYTVTQKTVDRATKKLDTAEQQCKPRVPDNQDRYQKPTYRSPEKYPKKQIEDQVPIENISDTEETREWYTQKTIQTHNASKSDSTAKKLFPTQSVVEKKQPKTEWPTHRESEQYSSDTEDVNGEYIQQTTTQIHTSTKSDNTPQKTRATSGGLPKGGRPNEKTPPKYPNDVKDTEEHYTQQTTTKTQTTTTESGSTPRITPGKQTVCDRLEPKDSRPSEGASEQHPTDIEKINEHYTHQTTIIRDSTTKSESAPTTTPGKQITTVRPEPKGGRPIDRVHKQYPSDTKETDAQQTTTKTCTTIESDSAPRKTPGKQFRNERREPKEVQPSDRAPEQYTSDSEEIDKHYTQKTTIKTHINTEPGNVPVKILEKQTTVEKREPKEIQAVDREPKQYPIDAEESNENYTQRTIVQAHSTIKSERTPRKPLDTDQQRQPTSDTSETEERTSVQTHTTTKSGSTIPGKQLTNNTREPKESRLINPTPKQHPSKSKESNESYTQQTIKEVHTTVESGSSSKKTLGPHPTNDDIEPKVSRPIIRTPIKYHSETDKTDKSYAQQTTIKSRTTTESDSIVGKTPGNKQINNEPKPKESWPVDKVLPQHHSDTMGITKRYTEQTAQTNSTTKSESTSKRTPGKQPISYTREPKESRLTDQTPQQYPSDHEETDELYTEQTTIQAHITTKSEGSPRIIPGKQTTNDVREPKGSRQINRAPEIHPRETVEIDKCYTPHTTNKTQTSSTPKQTEKQPTKNRREPKGSRPLDEPLEQYPSDTEETDERHTATTTTHSTTKFVTPKRTPGKEPASDICEPKRTRPFDLAPEEYCSDTEETDEYYTQQETVKTHTTTETGNSPRKAPGAKPENNRREPKRNWTLDRASDQYPSDIENTDERYIQKTTIQTYKTTEFGSTPERQPINNRPEPKESRPVDQAPQQYPSDSEETEERYTQQTTIHTHSTKIPETSSKKTPEEQPTSDRCEPKSNPKYDETIQQDLSGTEEIDERYTHQTKIKTHSTTTSESTKTKPKKPIGDKCTPKKSGPLDRKPEQHLSDIDDTEERYTQLKTTKIHSNTKSEGTPRRTPGKALKQHPSNTEETDKRYTQRTAIKTRITTELETTPRKTLVKQPTNDNRYPKESLPFDQTPKQYPSDTEETNERYIQQTKIESTPKRSHGKQPTSDRPELKGKRPINQVPKQYPSDIKKTDEYYTQQTNIQTQLTTTSESSPRKRSPLTREKHPNVDRIKKPLDDFKQRGAKPTVEQSKVTSRSTQKVDKYYVSQVIMDHGNSMPKTLNKPKKDVKQPVSLFKMHPSPIDQCCTEDTCTSRLIIKGGDRAKPDNKKPYYHSEGTHYVTTGKTVVTKSQNSKKDTPEETKRKNVPLQGSKPNQRTPKEDVTEVTRKSTIGKRPQVEEPMTATHTYLTSDKATIHRRNKSVQETAVEKHVEVPRHRMKQTSDEDYPSGEDEYAPEDDFYTLNIKVYRNDLKTKTMNGDGDKPKTSTKPVAFEQRNKTKTDKTTVYRTEEKHFVNKTGRKSGKPNLSDRDSPMKQTLKTQKPVATIKGRDNKTKPDVTRHVVTTTIQVVPKKKPSQTKELVRKSPSKVKESSKPVPKAKSCLPEDDLVTTEEEFVDEVYAIEDDEVNRTFDRQVTRTITSPQRELKPHSTSSNKIKPLDTKRPEKVITTKSIVINNDVEHDKEVIVNLQRSKSSREATPDRSYAYPASDDEDKGVPRYPDEICEPDDRNKRRIPARLSDIPIIETEDYLNKVDETDDCLLSVNEKVTKFANETDRLTNSSLNKSIETDSYKTNTLDRLNVTQRIPDRPKSPKCQNYPEDNGEEIFTSVSEKVSHFIETAEKVKSHQSTKKPKVSRPEFSHVDENIKSDDCLLSVSDKVTKFTSAADQRSPNYKTPISLSKIDAPRSISTITTECAQIESEEDMNRSLPYERKPSEPDTTPKSSRKDSGSKTVLSTTGHLRSTETVRKAKEVFENIAKDQTPTKHNKPRVEDELKSTRLIIDKINRSHVSETDDIPHYMRPLNRSPRPHSPYMERSLSPKDRSRSPSLEQHPKPHDPALDNIPHYMWPLDRTVHSPDRDHSRESSPSHTKPLDRTKSPVPSDHGTRSATLVRKSDEKVTNTSSKHRSYTNEEIDDILSVNEIEEIYSIEILEVLLEWSVSYEQRRRVRSQIRVVKQLTIDHKLPKMLFKKPSRSGSPKYKEVVVRKPSTTSTTHETHTVHSYSERKQSTEIRSYSREISPETKVTRKTPERKPQLKEIFKHELKRVEPNKKKVSEEKPSWITQRPLKKSSGDVPKTKAVSTKKPEQRQSPSKERKPIDAITSSYGVGPTDENGSPLFGLKALRAQTQTGTTKVQGTVIKSHYYSENGHEPTGEISVTKYSNDPNDFEGDADQTEGILSVTTTKRFGKGTPTQKAITDCEYYPEDEKIEEYDNRKSSSTSVTRRGSVKQMSKKFIENAVETSKTEKQSSYPKAGLILRTSSFKKTSPDDNESNSEGTASVTTTTVRKTTTTSSSGDTFLNNRSRARDVQDVITRMKNSDDDLQEGDTPDDVEARQLLNKFIGSQVILSGMETMGSSPSSSTVKRTTTTTTTTSKGGGKPNVVTRTFTHPITQEDLDTIWDEPTLKLLLERSTDYEERRIIRARLRDIMAEKEVCADVVKSHQESSGRVEEIVEKTEGPMTTTQVTTRVTSQQMSKKPISPFAKFRQLDKQNSLNTPPGTPKTPKGSAPLFKFTDPELNRQASTVKERLLQWCQMKTKEYENVQLDNFSSSWADGLAFCALIHHFKPDAFDYHALTPKDRRHNFTLAFRVADEKADIVPLLDVDDMVATRKPDWKCVFTYVQTIYARFKNED